MDRVKTIRGSGYHRMGYSPFLNRTRRRERENNEEEEEEDGRDDGRYLSLATKKKKKDATTEALSLSHLEFLSSLSPRNPNPRFLYFQQKHERPLEIDEKEDRSDDRNLMDVISSIGLTTKKHGDERNYKTKSSLDQGGGRNYKR
ncbi:uncharacterized protein LOC131298520 [Rhododendron vialii]|uniref:uncharacterized protein LOC131298520 n=1 Tax=Rhododendron vialii TaxID=182163 RepID=UPI00265F89CB|nr:uncharacterized protein LOC131298520 [Rhododendron vialii]